MTNASSKMLSSFKYGYLIVFFALLSGIFYPVITDTSFEPVISGILVLFLGLSGGILLHRATISETKREIFFGSGFVLIAISLYLIFQLTGRI